MRKLAVIMTLWVVLAGFAGAGLIGDLPPFTPDATMDRESIPEIFTWDLEDLYSDVAAWRSGLARAERGLEALAAMGADLGDPSVLAQYLGRYYDLELEVNRLTLFAGLRVVTDTTDQAALADHQLALSLTAEVMDEGAALREAVLAVPEDVLSAAYESVPGLEQFRPAIERLRRRSGRVLGAEAERVLGLAGDNLWAAIDLNELPSSVERVFQALISELSLPTITDRGGAPVALTFANFGRFRASADRQVRADAVSAMFGTLRSFENTFAAALGGQAPLEVNFARARGYDTALEAYLDKDDVETAVYRTLIDTVRHHTPSLHRYVALRQRVMGLDDVRIHDLYLPLVQSESREMSYAEGAEVILEALEPLGDEYLQAAARLIDPANGGVDVYPSKRKESGAFSSSVYGVHPFIKMNFQDSYDDVSTLAHELGHAMHTHLTNSSQPYLQSRYTMLLAEVASTCNEMLLSRYMLGRAQSDAERAWLLSELAEGIRQTIYRQTLFAEFELAVHELVEAGEPVTADRLNGIYEGLIRFYYGPGFTVGPDDAVEWAYIPHFYYKYYVYSYATGMASAIAIAERIAEGAPGAREAYIGMLKAGDSRPPVELLRDGGADLTSPEAIASALRYFDAVVAELETLLLAGS